MRDYPKYGHPRSEAERRRRHARLHGKGAKLPKRGTGYREGALARALQERG